jgi:hypothetical protein
LADDALGFATGLARSAAGLDGAAAGLECFATLECSAAALVCLAAECLAAEPVDFEGAPVERVADGFATWPLSRSVPISFVQ